MAAVFRFEMHRLETSSWIEKDAFIYNLTEAGRSC